MPELPEVETIARGLSDHLIGRQIMRVRQNRPNLRFDFPQDFARSLRGRKIIDISRRGKYLLTHLDDEMLWLTHLGMSGRFIFDPPHAVPHLHLLLEFDDKMRLGYIDPRRFGYMTLLPLGDQHSHRFLSPLGVEPLSKAFTPARLAQGLASRKSPIKTALLDQRIIAGLGNIYVCEALFMARIHPVRPANSLTRDERTRLVKYIRLVLKKAIKAGGSTLKDFAHVDGNGGYFQHAFQIYDRAETPCLRPKCDAIIKRITQSGRSSFFCPQCQAAPL